MGKARQNYGTGKVGSWEDLRRFTSQVVESIIQQVNGNLSFTENLFTSGPSIVEFAGPNDVQMVMHNLRRVPLGYVVVNQNAPIIVYKPEGDQYLWTEKRIFLQGSGVGQVTLFVLGG